VNLYIDDDSVDGVLVKLLRAAKHDVILPQDIGKSGAADADHLLEAIQRSRVVLTKIYGDFDALHRLVLFLGGHHPGIFVVRKGNDPKQAMDRKQTIRAIRNFAASGMKVEDGVHVLNFYR
jgi:Domain of unknown function (DUF5615)